VAASNFETTESIKRPLRNMCRERLTGRPVRDVKKDDFKAKALIKIRVYF